VRHQAATPPGPCILTDLGTFGGLSAQANDINDAGHVVGSAASTTSGGWPFIWQNGVMTDPGLLPGDEDSGAAAINNPGQIVGSSGRTDPDTYELFYRAFLYEGGVMTLLPERFLVHLRDPVDDVRTSPSKEPSHRNRRAGYGLVEEAGPYRDGSPFRFGPACARSCNRMSRDLAVTPATANMKNPEAVLDNNHSEV